MRKLTTRKYDIAELQNARSGALPGRMHRRRRCGADCQGAGRYRARKGMTRSRRTPGCHARACIKRCPGSAPRLQHHSQGLARAWPAPACHPCLKRCMSSPVMMQSRTRRAHSCCALPPAHDRIPPPVRRPAARRLLQLGPPKTASRPSIPRSRTTGAPSRRRTRWKRRAAASSTARCARGGWTCWTCASNWPTATKSARAMAEPFPPTRPARWIGKPACWLRRNPTGSRSVARS